MIRAVIYCRCSTEEESQKNALEKQVAEAESSVRQYGWGLVELPQKAAMNTRDYLMIS